MPLVVKAISLSIKYNYTKVSLLPDEAEIVCKHLGLGLWNVQAPGSMGDRGPEASVSGESTPAGEAGLSGDPC